MDPLRLSNVSTENALLSYNATTRFHQNSPIQWPFEKYLILPDCRAESDFRNDDDSDDDDDDEDDGDDGDGDEGESESESESDD